MWDMVWQWGLPGGLALGFAFGVGLAVIGMQWRTRRQRERERHEARKLHRSLHSTQVQLDQARKNIEALQEEVLGWRRRSALQSQVRSSRALPVATTPAAEDWVIAALLDGDARGGSQEGFADTQVLQVAH